jgi:exo-poly-alpha-galacturonosidase
MAVEASSKHPDSLRAPANLVAPSLAKTASTLLLLWDGDSSAHPGLVTYYIYQDGKMVGYTRSFCYTATNLAANTTYNFVVCARDEAGHVSAKSNQIQAITKSRGPVFDVREYGAKGDGKTKDTQAIQKAINDCTPGGIVLISPGVYLVDHLELKSDLTFELASGATLQFLGRKVGNYPVNMVSMPGPDGEATMRNFALISALRAKNLTITGGGVIRANGETWWPHKESPRPRVLQLIECADVFVQGITIEDPPAWNTHVVYVDRAVFSEVKFLKVSTAQGSNGDGLDPDSSCDVLIVGCQFGNQDDSIAIKASHRRPSENITIRDCLFDGTLAPGSHPLGFAIGSETSGGVRHVLLKNCVFRNVASVANIKANRKRPGAVVEDVRVENCTYVNAEFGDEPWNRAPIAIDLFYYRDYGPPDSVAPLTPATPVFRDIHFKNIVIENSKGRFAYLCGLIEQPARNITFENVTGSAKRGIHGQNLDGIELRNVAFNTFEGPAFDWINVQNRVVVPAAPAKAEVRQTSHD